jgi:hypothetical protein
MGDISDAIHIGEANDTMRSGHGGIISLFSLFIRYVFQRKKSWKLVAC